MPPVVNIAKAVITTPDQTIHGARFVFHDGRAAVWTEDKSTRKATRVLYATDATFTKPKSTSQPMTLDAADIQWQIRSQGGCGCGSPLKRFTFAQLLDPNLTEIG